MAWFRNFPCIFARNGPRIGMDGSTHEESPRSAWTLTFWTLLQPFFGDFQMILERKAWRPSNDNAPREFLSTWLATCGERCDPRKFCKNQSGSYPKLTENQLWTMLWFLFLCASEIGSYSYERWIFSVSPRRYQHFELDDMIFMSNFEFLITNPVILWIGTKNPWIKSIPPPLVPIQGATL